MKTITQQLTETVSKAFDFCGYAAELGTVTVSDRLDLCQFQCNGALKGAKLYHKAPLMIAKEVVEVLQEKEIFLAVEAVGCGFINMTLTEMYLMEWADRVNMDENLGIPQTDVPETILLDYGGPNVAKPLHIGHLRSAIIGESLKRLVKATGRTAISDVHLGDWGLQMGLVIAELQERNPEWKCFEDDFDAACDRIPALTADRLNEIYPFASKKSKEDSDFKRKAQTITARLQKGQAGYLALWKEIIRVSVGDMKKSYQKLNVDFDFWYGESDSEKYVDELIDRLKDQKLLYKSEGALVVDVAEESDKAEIPPIIIKKTDHSNIYATTDLATIIQREKDFSPNQLWYVVDSRQSLHFTQVFRCAKKAGLVPPTTSLEHLGFGTMNGSDGKPYKTRDGGVMPLSELFEKVLDTAYERVKSSDYSDDEAKPEVAKKLAVAAIKFGDLINHRSKDYIFDMDKFLASEGKTGIFLLYTVARINSILKKAEISDLEQAKLCGIYSDVERDLLLKVILSGESFFNAYQEKAPNFICENAYLLASVFSKFYYDNHILKEENSEKRRSWIWICLLVKKMLMKHLDVLGIESVEMM